jgi:hypothetical protein
MGMHRLSGAVLEGQLLKQSRTFLVALALQERAGQRPPIWCNGLALMRLLDTFNRISFTIAFGIALSKLLQQPCSAFNKAQCILLALLERCRGAAGCGWGLLDGSFG